MRIKSVEISGFRAFTDSMTFDLDGDIVLFVGVNGQGKTSLFDAIHWAITGQVARLANPKSIVSLYSDSGEARVQVTLVSQCDSTLVLTRRSDGEKESFYVTDGIEGFHGDHAEVELLRRLWPTGLTATDPKEALNSALERGVYLQQDVLTDFLTADTDQDRFNAIGELMGTGRATELQVYLERARLTWSRITNEKASEADTIGRHLQTLESQLGEMSDTGPTIALDPSEWTAWWSRAVRLGISRIEVPRLDSSDAQAALDVAMAQLQAVELSHERRRVRIQELEASLQQLPSEQIDLKKLRRAVEDAELALKDTQERLREAEQSAAEIRRRQLERGSEQQDLLVLAEVALRHLGDHCPVCQQTYEYEVTRERLQNLIRAASSETDLEPDGLPDIPAMSELVRSAEYEVSTAVATFEDAQRQNRIRTSGQERIQLALRELSIESGDDSATPSTIQSALRENARTLESLKATVARGESLALSLAWVGQLARRAELEGETLRVREQLFDAQKEVQDRRTTGDLASSIIECIRDASSQLVQIELGKLDELLQRIYSAVDPHPEFRVVSLVSRMQRGRGRVLAELEDPTQSLQISTPSSYLSSSQMNVLAVSVFLALNLGIPAIPLSVAILDDPLQSLDDLNLLGLIDLLKRMRERRQLLIATHDTRFASLLERKLRPVSDGQRTIVVELAGWSRMGPAADQRDVRPDLDPIRIAAA